MQSLSSMTGAPASRDVEPSGWLRLIFAGGLAAAFLLFGPIVQRSIDELSAPAATNGPINPACGWWDNVAVETLTRLARSGADADLRQTSDLLFRLQRARRNCRAGWLELASEDYRAIGGMEPAATNPGAPGPIATSRR